LRLGNGNGAWPPTVKHGRSNSNGICKVLRTVSGVNYNLNNKRANSVPDLLVLQNLISTLYYARNLRPILYVLQNFDRKFANLAAPPTERTAKCLTRCKVHLGL